MAGRPIECDRAEAARKATECFWRRGYGRASVDDLVRGTGLSRAGLYGDFGGKKGLFLKACELYSTAARERFIRPLDAARDPESGLRSLVDEVVKGQCKGKGPRGCLMAHALSDEEARAPDIRRAIAEHFRSLEEALARALARASGSRGSAQTAATAAAFLLNAILGLVQSARLAPAPTRLRAIGRAAVDAALGIARGG